MCKIRFQRKRIVQFRIELLEQPFVSIPRTKPIESAQEYLQLTARFKLRVRGWISCVVRRRIICVQTIDLHWSRHDGIRACSEGTTTRGCPVIIFVTVAFDAKLMSFIGELFRCCSSCARTWEHCFESRPRLAAKLISCEKIISIGLYLIHISNNSCQNTLDTTVKE